VTRSQSIGASRAPQVGDIWKDTSCGYERHVRVDAVYTQSLLIKGVKPVEMRAGRRWVIEQNAKTRSTKLLRFTGPKPDFQFVEVA
jgi:hypothetical protein